MVSAAGSPCRQWVTTPGSNYILRAPQPLEIHEPQAAEKWKKMQKGLDRLFVGDWVKWEIRDSANRDIVDSHWWRSSRSVRDVYSLGGRWWCYEDQSIVLDTFEAYCKPRKNIPFGRYQFNRHVQDSGETYDQYRIALRQLSEGCDSATITPDEILRDRLVFGMRDTNARERLLHESKLTLTKTDEICHAAESTPL